MCVCARARVIKKPLLVPVAVGKSPNKHRYAPVRRLLLVLRQVKVFASFAFTEEETTAIPLVGSSNRLFKPVFSYVSVRRRRKYRYTVRTDFPVTCTRRVLRSASARLHAPHLPSFFLFVFCTYVRVGCPGLFTRSFSSAGKF